MFLCPSIFPEMVVFTPWYSRDKVAWPDDMVFEQWFVVIVLLDEPLWHFGSHCRLFVYVDVVAEVRFSISESWRSTLILMFVGRHAVCGLWFCGLVVLLVVVRTWPGALFVACFVFGCPVAKGTRMSSLGRNGPKVLSCSSCCKLCSIDGSQLRHLLMYERWKVLASFLYCIHEGHDIYIYIYIYIYIPN